MHLLHVDISDTFHKMLARDTITLLNNSRCQARIKQETKNKGFTFNHFTDAPFKSDCVLVKQVLGRIAVIKTPALLDSVFTA